MGDDERRAEIEAVKRTRPKVGALIGAWRRYADDLEAALDPVRDARGDDAVSRAAVAKWLRDAPAVTGAAFLAAFPVRDARGDDEPRTGRDG